MGDNEENKKNKIEDLIWKNLKKIKSNENYNVNNISTIDNDKMIANVNKTPITFTLGNNFNNKTVTANNYKTNFQNINNYSKLNNKTKDNKSGKKEVQKVKLFINKNCKITIKPSNKIISTILAKCKNTEYNLKNNEWYFEVDDYECVTGGLHANKISYDKIPVSVLQMAKKEYKNDKYMLVGGIYDLLMDFQREAVYYAMNRGGRILLGDDMGLGKTIQALAIAYYYKIEFPLLIITPSSLSYNWMDSVSRFLNEEGTIVREKADFGSRITIISYNLAVNYIEIIKAFKFRVIICDECHYLKSTASKRTKLLLPILQSASRLIMISGTPATSRPVELFPILSALDKNLFNNFQVYGIRYCDGRKIGNYFDYKGSTNAEELGLILEKCFMIRRTKDCVLGQLPLKFRRQIILDIPNNKLKTSFSAYVGDTPDSTIMQEYKEAASLKKDAVLKYIENIMDKNVKNIVFAHHKEMMDAIEEFCVVKEYKYMRIDGTTITTKRNKNVEIFQNDETVRIAILSLTACCTGLTLTAAKAVIFAELYWNPGTMLQAEDRIHRIGQKDNIDIHYLVGHNTIDEMVWPKLLKKLNVLESLGMSKNELKGVKGVEEKKGYSRRLEF